MDQFFYNPLIEKKITSDLNFVMQKEQWKNFQKKYNR